MTTRWEVNKVLDTMDEEHCSEKEYYDSFIYGESARERANGIRYDREHTRWLQSQNLTI